MSWKKKFKNVRAIDTSALEKLTAAGIGDLKQLQDRFYGNLHGSLREAEQSLNVPPDVLAGLIAKSLIASAEPLTTSWTRRYWADSVLILAFLYVVLALGRPWLSGGLSGGLGGTAPPKPVPRVVAAGTIPIYGMIREDSLGVTNAAPDATKKEMLARFVGRYALNAIPAGTAITESQLSRKPFDISGQSILQIELKRALPLDGRELPEDVDLLFSARQGTAAGISIPGRLLALDMKATPPVAAIALSKDKADEAAKWIGSSDVYLSLHEK